MKFMAAFLSSLLLFGCAAKLVQEAAPAGHQWVVQNMRIPSGMGRVICSLGKFSWAQLDEPIEIYVNEIKIGLLGNKEEILAIDLYPQIYSFKWKLASASNIFILYPMAVTIKSGEVVHLAANLRTEGIFNQQFVCSFEQIRANKGAELIKSHRLILLDQDSKERFKEPAQQQRNAPTPVDHKEIAIVPEKIQREENEKTESVKPSEKTEIHKETTEISPSAGAQIIERKPPKSLSITGTGTGFFVNGLGHILTNAHVVDGCSALQVRLPGGHALYADLLHFDSGTDLAIAKVDSSLARMIMGWKGQAVKFRLGKSRLGDEVVVFGFPLTGALSSKGNLTTGNITALSGLDDNESCFQISAPVQPGNSGGPLFDNSGYVIGIVVSKLDTFKALVATGDIPQNVNFAIKGEIGASFLSLYQIPYSAMSKRPQENFTAADIADEALKYTVRIECLQYKN
jgi:S1-C subfamily serine protease